MEPAINLEVVDLTPRFLTFYDAAQATGTDADERWRLWQEHYGFAAVPPTPDGQALARRLLDDAWTAYPDIVGQIRAGAAGLAPAPEPILRSVARILDCRQDVTVRLVVFVGALEGNAFSTMNAGLPIRSCALSSR